MSDADQHNQHDSNYMALRADANREGDQMAQLFHQAHNAHESGNGADAKRLADEAREHEQKMEELNRQASDWIFHGIDVSINSPS